MKLLIKNMVCGRCITAVKEILVAEGVTAKGITLGEAEIAETLSPEQRVLTSSLRHPRNTNHPFFSAIMHKNELFLV